MTAFVALDGVRHAYGGTGAPAVEGLTMQVHRGDFVAVVGPSGCGKSTLMKLATGLQFPQAGSVMIDGTRVDRPVKMAGMAFQAPTLLPWRTTRDNILLPLEIVQPHRSRMRRNRREYRGRAEALLASVGLAGQGSKYPWELSGGMQMRAALCRALIHEPALLMLDEPFGALDAFTREELWGVIRDLHATRRMTVVLVTHDLREAVFLADTIFVMSARPGRIIVEHRNTIPRPRELDVTFTPEFQADGAGFAQPYRARPRRAGGGHALNDADGFTAPLAAPPPPGRLAALRATRDRMAASPVGRFVSSHRTIIIQIGAPLLFLVLLLVVWQAAISWFGIPPFILPTPLSVWRAFGQFQQVLWDQSLYTFGTTLAGFGIAIVFGLAVGLAVGGSRTLYAGLYPLMVGFNAIPKVAVVPILAIWFGNGEVPAILTAFLISFFPIVVNVATGLATIEPEMEDVLRALGGSKLDIMRKVGVPRAMPYFFGSLKVAVTLAFVGSVIAEGIASNDGIGKLILQAQAMFQIPLVYACLVVLAVQGILLYAVMALIEQRMTRWARRSGFGKA